MLPLVDGSEASTRSSGSKAMDKQQRRVFLDRLCGLRDDYARRGRADSISVISIEATISWASRRLDRSRTRHVVVSDDGSAVI
jgi:hypothetical protein